MKIELTGLRKSYFLGGNEIPVLRGIDLVLEPGELVSLTGPSGVGKSTLLHIIGTLDGPSSGSVLMNGEDVFAMSPGGIADFRNRHVGFVFQFHHLLPEFSALENTMMPARISRVPHLQAERRAKELLDQVGLDHRMHHRAGELSGGEQQRVALARALMNEPEILLADEPTGNLDEKTGAGIHEVMEKLNEERGITVLMVTHNPRLADRMPRQIRLGKEGIEEGATAAAVPATPAAIPASSAQDLA